MKRLKIDTELSRLLKAQMRLCGYRQVDVKKELDELDYPVDKSTISRWINGSRKPNNEDIEQLANAFKIDKNKLYRAAGYLVEGESGTGSTFENKIIDQATAQSLNQHWQEMADIASYLAVSKYDDSGNLLDQGELQDQIDTGFDAATEHFGELRVKCFEAHVNAEVDGFWDDLYRATDTMQILAHRRTFTGTCQICKDYQ